MDRYALVIDDSPLMRDLIISSLSNLSELKPIEASGAFEALKILPQRSFDIILTDINMPEVTGLELLTFLKSHPSYRTIPVIIITTEKNEEDRNRGIALGAEDYVTKPFDPRHLLSIIRRLLKI